MSSGDVTSPLQNGFVSWAAWQCRVSSWDAALSFSQWWGRSCLSEFHRMSKIWIFIPEVISNEHQVATSQHVRPDKLELIRWYDTAVTAILDDSQQTQFGWAWEDWCRGAHNQLNFLSWSAKHSMLYGYICTYMHVTAMNRYVDVCSLYEHVYTHYSYVCTWISQNITNILDCVCWQLSMPSIDG